MHGMASRSWRWMRSNIAPLIDSNGDFNSFIGIANDITENKSVETALYNSEKGYIVLFNSFTEAIYIMDDNGFLIYLERKDVKIRVFSWI